MRSLTAVAVALVLGAVVGCAGGDGSGGGGSPGPTTPQARAADAAVAMLLTRADVGATKDAGTRREAHLDDASACAVSSGAEARRLAAVARTWQSAGSGTILQVLATFRRGDAARVMTSLAADKSSVRCVHPVDGFDRVPGQPVTGVPAPDQSSWCYRVSAGASKGFVCTAYVRRGEVITGIQMLGTDPAAVRGGAARLAGLAYSRLAAR